MEDSAQKHEISKDQDLKNKLDECWVGWWQMLVVVSQGKQRGWSHKTRLNFPVDRV